MSSVVLIQEPWVNKNKILELRTKDSTLFCGCNEDVSRTCIITKGMLPFVYLSLVVRTKLLYVLILKTNKEYIIVDSGGINLYAH